MQFKFPDASRRTTIVGGTGSGKTRFAAWLWSHSDFRARPYIVIDYKGDDLIAQIDKAQEIGLRDSPRHPGLYVVRPLPHQHEEVDQFLYKIWLRRNTGLWIDEGFMIPRSKYLDAILTQGRSLRIPATILTQRPSGCSRHVFAQADCFALFEMNDTRDLDPVLAMTPRDDVWRFDYDLPRFSCRWRDNPNRFSAVIDPVPDDDYILNRFDDALRRPIRGV
jgi:DNA helicase HerA-like ATPase